jgi:hypothetical protein
MAWNFDISQAPKGGIRQIERTVGKNVVTVEEYEAPPIIAAGNGGVVTVSRWNPKREAWSMFTKDCPPMAWMPWPEHPGETK